MITRTDIEKLAEIRRNRRKYEKLDKDLTAELLARATEDSHEWKGLAYSITEGHTTTADKEEIKKLPDWEKYFKTSTYTKINITT